MYICDFLKVFFFFNTSPSNDSSHPYFLHFLCSRVCLFFSAAVVMTRWIDQIREALNDQDTAERRDECGPLQEIAFWKSRSSKLARIHLQLQEPGVHHIQDILLRAKSKRKDKFSLLARELEVRVKHGEMWEEEHQNRHSVWSQKHL